MVSQKETIKAIAKREKEEAKAIAKREKEEAKWEKKKTTEIRMRIISIRLSEKFPDGFSSKHVTEEYLSRHGRINPYTLELSAPSYDIHAAIRGYMYESSPSSLQHWFKYGHAKKDKEVSEWIFANKDLAILNNNNGWNISSSEVCSIRRKCKDNWIKMPPTTRKEWQPDNISTPT